MKNFLITILSVIIILLIGGQVRAQSIDSLVNEAIANNPQLKSLQYRIEASEYRSESVHYLPPPNLSVEFSQVPVDEINLWDKAISNSLSLSQMFPLGGKLGKMSETERKNVEVIKDDYDAYKASLTAKVKMTYYNIWQIERKIEVQQETIELMNDLLSSIEIIYQVNRINQADVFTVRSEVASNNAQLIIFKKQRESEIYKLNQLLGRNLESSDIMTDGEISGDSLKYSQSQLEEILINRNPSLQKMSSMIEMNKAMITANNSELVPDLMLEGMIMRMPRGMILTSKTDLSMLAHEPQETEYMYSLMASITLPFVPWSSGKYEAKEEELLAGIKGIEYERTDMQREIFANMKAALVRLSTANELIDLYATEIIPNYQQAVTSQVSNYQNNRSIITTVIDSYRMLLMQQMNYYMVQADRQMAIAEIEMMVGTNLKNSLLSEGNY
ncbi:MAG: TolC family protein [Bacteroidales bacterium]|nr:TolC family protein [Bacteroidales bacterium]